MRRLGMIGLSGVLALSLAGPAMAHAFKVTGTVAAGNPLRLTENGGSCDPASPLNGVDGWWYDIHGFGGHQAILTMDADADFDAYWYDDACDLIDDDGMAQKSLGETEKALVPDGAGYVIVNLVNLLANDETFRLQIC